MVIPVHQSGDLRYATPSPATAPACERRSPFFFNTKLEPISRPLHTASMIPTTLRLLPTDTVVDGDGEEEAVEDVDEDVEDI